MKFEGAIRDFMGIHNVLNGLLPSHLYAKILTLGPQIDRHILFCLLYIFILYTFNPYFIYIYIYTIF